MIGEEADQRAADRHTQPHRKHVHPREEPVTAARVRVREPLKSDAVHCAELQ